MSAVSQDLKVMIAHNFYRSLARRYFTNIPRFVVTIIRHPPVLKSELEFRRS